MLNGWKWGVLYRDGGVVMLVVLLGRSCGGVVEIAGLAAEYHLMNHECRRKVTSCPSDSSAMS
jgi:hypothetical protein